MSFLDHIDACNAHDPSGFLPFSVEGTRVGWVRHGFAATLAGFADVFAVAERCSTLSSGLDDYTARTEAVDRVLRALAANGVIAHWRDEPYPVGPAFAGSHFFEMERAAVPHFGVRAYGVHINGFVRDGRSILMWIGRRATDRPICPGQLDNMVAGGQPVGLGLMENVIKEAGEEASVPAALAANAVSVGALTYCMEAPAGLKPDTLFCYDLELPRDFTPVNTDGEISDFYLWPVERVMEIVETGAGTNNTFKFNCNLVNIDFFVRHGLIRPDRPDYLDIVRGLHL